MIGGLLQFDLTEERLAALLDEHDWLGGRILEVDGRLAADEEALEVARGGPERRNGPAPLSEVHERIGILDRARSLSAEDVGRAMEEREAALERRRRIAREIGDGLPEGEWIACGEWAFRVSREYGSRGPRILNRALAASVRWSGGRATPGEVLTLSGDLEQARRCGERSLRFLSSPARVGKAALWPGACLCAIAALDVGLALASGAVMLVLALMLNVAPPPERRYDSPEYAGTVFPDRLTVAYRLPENEPNPMRAHAAARGLPRA